MKITKQSVMITDVPGVKSITIEPDVSGVSDVVITLVPAFSMDYPWSFGYAELTDLRDALTEALKQARMIGDFPEPDAGTAVALVYNEGDREPIGVRRVSDRDEDVWERQPNGEWYCGGLIRSWEGLLSTHGPVTAEPRS